MQCRAHSPSSISGMRWSRTNAALATVLTFLFLAAQPAQAQRYRVIHDFTGGADGAEPFSTVTMDAAGNLYGTALLGGYYGFGTVFKLSPNASGWDITELYTFTGGVDGGYPYSRVINGPDGGRYGVDGSAAEDGAVFNVKPARLACRATPCPWTEATLYLVHDGADVSHGNLTSDQAGNIYGTSASSENVYQLTPSHGGWTYSNLYTFAGGHDGYWPFDGVTFDRSGNLYGTTLYGGTHNWGTVFQLTPSASGWTEKILYSFQGGNDGGLPLAGLVIDASGKLYGATSSKGPQGGGTIFQLTPSSDGNWIFTLLYGFSGALWSGPDATLVVDRAGALYGTKSCYMNGCGGNNGYGTAFKLTPGSGSWSYTSLHDFTSGSDGGDPHGGVVVDANGNVYGMTAAGGAYGYGVVWEITP